MSEPTNTVASSVVCHDLQNPIQPDRHTTATPAGNPARVTVGTHCFDMDELALHFPACADGISQTPLITLPFEPLTSRREKVLSGGNRNIRQPPNEG